MKNILRLLTGYKRSLSNTINRTPNFFAPAYRTGRPLRLCALIFICAFAPLRDLSAQKAIHELPTKTTIDTNYLFIQGNPTTGKLYKTRGAALNAFISGGGGTATDTTSLSNRIDLKLNISDTTGLSNRIDAIGPHIDTTSLSNRIDAISSGSTDTTSLSNRIDAIPTISSFSKNAGRDSTILLLSSGTRYAVKDSIGAGGGGGGVSDNNTAWYNKNNLKWIEYHKQLMDDNQSDFVFTFLGDSKIAYTEVIPKTITEVLGTKGRVNGQGYMPIGFFVTGLFNTTPLDNGSTWDVKDYNSGGKNLALYSLVSKSGSQPIGWTINSSTVREWNRFTNLKIGYWGQVGGGTFEVRIDGTLTNTVNTAALTGLQELTITGLTDVAHSVSITPISDTCELLYLNPYRLSSYLSGYKLHSIGHSGATVDTYNSADTTTWNPQFINLGTNLLVIYLGTNERHENITPSAFKSNMKARIAELRALQSKLDIVLWAQVDEGMENPYFSGSIYTSTEYNNVLKEISDEDSVAYFDISKLAGDYSINSRQPWLSDGIHESLSGAFAEAVNFLDGLPSIGTSINTALDIARTTFVSIQSNGSSGGIVSATVLNAGGITGAVNGVNTTALNSTLGGNIAGLRMASHAGNAFLSSGPQLDVSTDALGINLLASAQGSVVNNFYIGNWYESIGFTIPRAWNQSSNILKINQGWGEPNTTSIRANTIAITGVLDMSTAVASNIVSGFYYNPTITNLGSATHRAIETTTGDVFFGTTSGSVGIGVLSAIDASSILDITSTTKGFLPPRMTKTQRDAISSPATGLVVYQTDNTPGLRCYNGTNWMRYTETAD